MGIDFGYIAVVLVVILLSMTLHEAMHAFASYWLGDNTAKNEGRLTLNPIKHIDPVLTIALPLVLAVVGGPIFGGAKPVPFNPGSVRWGEYGAALVGLAGPFTNLVLSFVFFGLLVAFGDAGGFVTTFLQLSVVVNIGFFIFNMIPIPPLDGSRALYAIAPDVDPSGYGSHGTIRHSARICSRHARLDQYIGQFIGATQLAILQRVWCDIGVVV
jgi:Zn-dependent protease